MKGNFHVQFLGEGEAAMLPFLPGTMVCTVAKTPFRTSACYLALNQALFWVLPRHCDDT